MQQNDEICSTNDQLLCHVFVFRFVGEDVPPIKDE